MASFTFVKLMGSVFSSFGAGVAISVVSLATQGSTATLQTAMTNPITGIFVALGFGVGFALEYSDYKKEVKKEESEASASKE